VRAVNLIPADQRRGMARGPARSGGGAYAVLAVLGGLAVCALAYGIAHHQVSTRSVQAKALAARTQASQARAALLAPYTSFIALREQRTQAVLGIVNSRFDWAHALHELGRVLPPGASIASVTGTVGSAGAAAGAAAAKPGASGVSATPPGSVPTVTIAGCATSQSEVALTLDRLRLIDGVSEVTLTSSAKSATSGAGGGAGCPGSDPSYITQVFFAPLPSTSAVSSSAAPRATVSAGGAR
jgi:Tfp pilus assembly protein PilN